MLGRVLWQHTFKEISSFIHSSIIGTILVRLSYLLFWDFLEKVFEKPNFSFFGMVIKMFLMTDCSQNFLWEPSHYRVIQFLIFNSETRSFIRYPSSYTGSNICVINVFISVTSLHRIKHIDFRCFSLPRQLWRYIFILMSKL